MTIMSTIRNNYENSKISQKRTFFQKYGLLLISHHPECEEFKNHTLKIGPLRFCIGCFIGYPTAIISIIILNLLEIQFLFDSITHLSIGLFSFSFFILSPLNLTKQKRIKIMQKFCIGIGSSFLFWWVWTLSSNMIVNLIIFIIVFGTIIVILNGYHAYSFLKICRACKYKSDWRICPGFRKVYSDIRNRK